MGECQGRYPYTQDALQALTVSLSPARLRTYLNAAGWDGAAALALYLHNARLAKSFLFPLHVVEVLLRNAVDEFLLRAEFREASCSSD